MLPEFYFVFYQTASPAWLLWGPAAFLLPYTQWGVCKPDGGPQHAEETGLNSIKLRLLPGPRWHLQLKTAQYCFFHPRFHLILHENY